MKIIKITGEYIVKQDLINMLEKFLEELKQSKCEMWFESESNIGGKLEVVIKQDDIEDLRGNFQKKIIKEFDKRYNNTWNAM